MAEAGYGPLSHVLKCFSSSRHNLQNRIPLPLRFQKILNDLPEPTRSKRVHNRVTGACEIGEKEGEEFQPRHVDISSYTQTMSYGRRKTNEIRYHDDDNITRGLKLLFAEELKHFPSLHRAMVPSAYRFDSPPTCFNGAPDERT